MVISMKKRAFILLIICVIVITFAGCGNKGEETEDTYSDNSSIVEQNDTDRVSFDTNETWAIYWYLCGSDLESENGAATDDLSEMMEVTLPDNITIVIQTGGANEWMNDTVDASLLQRYLYKGENMELVDEQPQESMGDEKTLQDFLSFCEENYPAEHKMVLFWDHGGGSIGGAACDENFDFDSLSLLEMEEAFDAVYRGADTPLELVGFDTCLMSTLDTANLFKKYASYLVASEEMEPGNGWDYSAWLTELANNTGINGGQLGTIICDTYLTSCEEYDTADEITLAVTDLSELDGLLDAFNNLGKEILSEAIEVPTVCGEFARSAHKAENYGGNNEIDGYTNMVDLGDLVKNSVNLLPETANQILEAVDRAVIYKVNGPYRPNATGLSVYYSYNGDTEELEQYNKIAADGVYPSFIQYSITGEVSEEALNMIEEPENQIITPLEEFEDDMPVIITEENYARLTLNPENLARVKSVFYNLAYYSEEEDMILFIGRDNDLYADWENGIFEDNYRGVWGAIDGSLCYMEITYEGEDYNLYSVPINLNGKDCVMRVVYDFEEEAYKILGIRDNVDEETLMGDKNLKHLTPGDQVTPILYAMSMEDGNDEVYEISDETIMVTDDSTFEEVELGDGTFAFMFEVVDTANNSYDSEIVLFESVDDEITFFTD